MALGNARREFAGHRSRLLLALVVLTLATGTVWAQQMTATMTGRVKDTSGAIVPEATVTVKHVGTGTTRVAQTDGRGNYRLPALPVGPYEVTAERSGFNMAVRRGITLVVGQEAVVDLTLEVGSVEQQVTVTAEAPLVNTTLSSTAGLVGEKQVKDLPLNGRSFDQLLTLNAGTVDYSENSSRNAFSVSGRRPDENKFTINGIEYIGTKSSAQETQPYGSSGQLLGVDAVREFNVQTDTYGAEHGKKAGGQVSIVTDSGTNQLHGSAFEYLRNNVLDARNFFDIETPPFRRNQFGGTLGGPIKRDKFFAFGSYEGFRQRRGGSGQSIVPDENARKGLLPIGPNNSLIPAPDLQPRMLEYMKLWKEPNGPNVGGGGAILVSNPVKAIREDFGLLRLDYTISEKDFLSATILRDDGEDSEPSAASHFIDGEALRSLLVGFQETRVVTPAVVNVATLGVSRTYAASGTGPPTIQFPEDLRIFEGSPVPGSVNVTNFAGSGGSIRQLGGRTNYTLSDDVRYTRGNHSFSFGAWVQRVHDNVARGTTGGGRVRYTTLANMLRDRPRDLQGVGQFTPMGWRMTHVEYYIQDEIKLRPNFTLRLGLRDMMTSGWNEVNCRGSNYWFDQNGHLMSEPHVGCSILSENKATFLALLQPRVGLAWDPTGTGKSSVRAGWGMYNSVQNIFGWRLTNPPFNGLVFFQNTPMLSIIPLPGGTELQSPPCTAERVAANVDCQIYSPNGVESNFKMPTVVEWNLTIEREIARDLMFRIGYNGSEGYHSMTNVHVNQAYPVVCNDPAGCVSGGAGTERGLAPQGKTYLPPGPMPNPYVGASFLFLFQGTNNYHGMDVSLTKRFSQGLGFRVNYTFSKALDLNTTQSSSASTNAPQTIYDRYNIGLSKGVAAFNLTNKFNANFSYELPFGNGATGVWGKLLSGWQWNGILTARDGFPVTPQVGRNISGTGDSREPDTPDRNPAFSGPEITGTAEQWFDPRAFRLPIPGTFGNVGKGILVGPGQFNVDTSLFKRIPLTENWNMHFRFEVFNVLNHTNLSTPTSEVFSGSNYSPTAGRINNTATTSRELQFALRLTF